MICVAKTVRHRRWGTCHDTPRCPGFISRGAQTSVVSVHQIELSEQESPRFALDSDAPIPGHVAFVTARTG
jgi:hypothetical protein